ncbi:MAG: redox-regulated ATPase YchF [Peptococcaceae bacterium]
MLTFGIIGLPLVGKTTIFNLVTGKEAQTSQFITDKTTINVGTALVPDARVDFLGKVYQPKRLTYAQIQCQDVPGLKYGSEEEKGKKNRFLEDIRSVDALVHVLWAFENTAATKDKVSIDLWRDVEIVNLELLFADLELLEKRLSRLKQSKKITKEVTAEIEVLSKCKEAIEKEIPLANLDLSPAERSFLQHYQFFTTKPLILVVNTGEEQFKRHNYPQKELINSKAKTNGWEVIEVCGQLEAEISLLSPTDRAVFLADLGVQESGIERLVRVAYTQLGLISFFTVGKDEVKAWTITQGLTSKQAAGKVHSDIERGFIRAEVVKFQDLYALGSMEKIKEKGLARLEGKDYLVCDGDIINFRFNV